MDAGAEELNFAIIRLARRHRYRASQLLGRHGLHPGQEVILCILADQGEQSQAKLAALLEVEPPTVHRSLISLEQAGFVQRRPSPSDGRMTLVSLTGSGREAETQVAAAWAQLGRETVSGFSDRDRRALLRLLDRAGANLNNPDVRDC